MKRRERLGEVEPIAANSPKAYLYTISERHHYGTQANQTLALRLGSGFSPGFFHLLMPI